MLHSIIMEMNEIISAGGGVVNLSRRLGLSHVTVLRWKHVPDKRLAAVSEITGIPVDELRPDLAQLFKKG